MMRPRFVTLMMLAALPTTASAQFTPRPDSVEFGGGVVYIGSSTLGTAKATETRNQTGATDPLTLFETDARLQSAAGIGAHVGFNLTSRIAIESALTYSRPSIRTSVSNDFERSPDIVIGNSSLQQYFIDLGLIVHVRALHLGSRGLPFMTGRIGYLHQVTDERASTDSGRVYQVGGGLKQMLTTGGRIGLRFDARLGIRDGGLTLDDHTHRRFFVAGAGTFVLF
jgi:hypothetical protein